MDKSGALIMPPTSARESLFGAGTIATDQTRLDGRARIPRWCQAPSTAAKLSLVSPNHGLEDFGKGLAAYAQRLCRSRNADSHRFEPQTLQDFPGMGRIVRLHDSTWYQVITTIYPSFWTDKLVIRRVGADPEPRDSVWCVQADGSVMETDASRPKTANYFEMQGRMTRIALQLIKTLLGQTLDVRRQFPITRPETGRSLVFQRSVHLPSRMAARVSSAR